MKTWKSLIAVPLIIGMSWTQVSLADTGLQLGLNAGYADIKWSEFDDSASAQAYFAYNFIDWLGVEAGYTDLGTFDVKSGDNGIDLTASHLTLNMNGDFGWDIEVFAKLGLYHADINANCTNCGGDKERSETGFTYTAGLAKEVVNHVAITASWQNYYKVDEETDFNLYQLGIRFDF